jgi:dihydroorotase
MPLEEFNNCELPATADFHVHLRDGDMMKLCVPSIRQGGVNTVYVMVSRYSLTLQDKKLIFGQPNLVPPITTVNAALEYKKRLQQLESNVNFLMSLYLHPDVTPETVKEAKKAGITGIKSYPAGIK